MLNARSIGLAWVAAQFVLLGFWVASVFAVPDALNRATRFLPLTLLGIIAVTAGFGLALTASLQLGRSFTPNPEPKNAAELLQSGPYARIRHPIYGGVLMIVWGITLPLLTLPLLLTAVMFTFFLNAKAKYEEKRLMARFPDYERYKKRTWRFFPRLSRTEKA